MMKCGDIVRNYWAGDENPTRYFIYLKNEGKYTSAINFDGKKLRKGKYYTDHIKKEPDKFVVVGHIDLIDYIKAPLLELLQADYEGVSGDGRMICITDRHENTEQIGAKEFFRKAKEICQSTYCFRCPIFDICTGGIFASGDYDFEKLVAIVEGYQSGRESK